MEDEFTSVRWDRDSTITSSKPVDPLASNKTTTSSPAGSPARQRQSSSQSENIPVSPSQTSRTPSTSQAQRQQQQQQQKQQHQQQKPNTYSTNDDDNSVFINSKVSVPQKESDGQNAYISYLIETHTNSPVFKSTRLKVRRRFSDFYFLYQCLLNDYPACAMPPLPDKQRLEYLKGDRFGHDFTSKRANSLNRFLKRMSLHPVLKRAKIYHIFLESNDWNSYKESLNVNHLYVNNNNGGSGGHLDGAHESETLGPSSSVTDTISDLFMNAFKHPQSQPNKEFVEINERCNKLNDNVIKIDKSFQKYVKRLGDLNSNFNTFAELVVKLDQLESANPLGLENAVKDMKLTDDSSNSNGTNSRGSNENESHFNGIINNQPISKPIPTTKEEAEKNINNSSIIANHNVSSFVKFSKGLENLALGLNHLKRYLDNDYLISLKDLENYIYSIKSLIKVKEQKQIDFEVLSEYLSRAIHEKNQLLQQTGTHLEQEIGTSAATPHNTSTVANNPNITLPAPRPSTLTSLATSTSNFLTSKIDDIRGINSTYQKKERLIKLSVKIETLEKEVINAKKVFEVFENEILHEVQYFDVIKSNELKLNLSDLTDNYISFYKGMISDWEHIEKALENDINEHNKNLGSV